MVLPSAVLVVKGLGWAQGLLFCIIRLVGRRVLLGRACGSPRCPRLKRREGTLGRSRLPGRPGRCPEDAPISGRAL